jgi:hypothetical protein
VAKVGFTELISRHQLPTGTLDLSVAPGKIKGSSSHEPLFLYDGFQSQEHSVKSLPIPSAGKCSFGSLQTPEGACILIIGHKTVQMSKWKVN